MGPVIIETERLLLREWQLEDAEEFSAIAADPRVVRFITGGTPVPLEQVRDQIARLVALQESHGWTRWALQLRDPQPADPAGVIGFCGPGCTFAPDVEVGWWLHADLWGRGLATEAGLAAVRHGFEVVGFDRLICCVSPENLASRAVARKVGFRPVDRFDFHGVTLIRHALDSPLDDPPRDPRYRRDCEGAESGSAVIGASPQDA